MIGFRDHPLRKRNVPIVAAVPTPAPTYDKTNLALSAVQPSSCCWTPVSRRGLAQKVGLCMMQKVDMHAGAHGADQENGPAIEQLEKVRRNVEVDIAANRSQGTNLGFSERYLPKNSTAVIVDAGGLCCVFCSVLIVLFICERKHSVPPLRVPLRATA